MRVAQRKERGAKTLASDSIIVHWSKLIINEMKKMKELILSYPPLHSKTKND